MTAWLSLAISTIAIAISVILLRRMIDRRAGSASVMDEIRREVGAILTEMNQTTERNIELIEDKVRHLQATIELADKRLGTLHRESDRQEQAQKVYSHLGRIPGPPRVSKQSDSPPVQAASANGQSAEAQPLDVPALFVSAVTSSGAVSAHSAVRPAVGPASVQATEAEPATGVEEVVPTMKERVLGLYRQGISVERIASRVGTAVSEIEMIVSLGER